MGTVRSAIAALAFTAEKARLESFQRPRRVSGPMSTAGLKSHAQNKAGACRPIPSPFDEVWLLAAIASLRRAERQAIYAAQPAAEA